MARADSVAFPLLMDQPVLGRIAEFRADNAERFDGDEASLAEQAPALGRPQPARNCWWRDLRPPQNFVRHPVPDSSETFLQKQDRLYRRPRVPGQEPIEEYTVEGFRADIWSAGAPPIRRRFSVMKADAPEEARIAENKSAFCLVQNKVIVFLGSKARRLHP
ncbi:MAG: hypothetical protein QOG12_389 [Verrucomicrobiota bacterium]